MLEHVTFFLPSCNMQQENHVPPPLPTFALHKAPILACIVQQWFGRLGGNCAMWQCEAGTQKTKEEGIIRCGKHTPGGCLSSRGASGILTSNGILQICRKESQR